MFNEPFYFNKSNFKAEAKRRGQKANLHLTEGWTTVLESPAELGDATKQKQLAYYALGSLKRLRDESVHLCTFVLCFVFCVLCLFCKQCQFGIQRLVDGTPKHCLTQATCKSCTARQGQ